MDPMNVNDPEYLKKQYQDSSNLDARIRLHQRFSVNKTSWQRWVFDQIKVPDNCRILELGCGPGNLWMENAERIPEGWKIVLSDFSSGMLEQTRQNLKGRHGFQFKCFNAQSIPFEDAHFDAVIANHMLYHVADKAAAFSEILRVLKPGGCLYASTAGEQNLSEIRDLLCKFDDRLASWGKGFDSFTLENGMEQLAEWFEEVKLYRFEQALEVTEAAPLVDYVLSGLARQILEKRLDSFNEFVAREIESSGGVFHVSENPVLFVASRS
jgi:ubiquinone/menaquinone biosynthesis C-methylase UbiE